MPTPNTVDHTFKPDYYHQSTTLPSFFITESNFLIADTQQCRPYFQTWHYHQSTTLPSFFITESNCRLTDIKERLHIKLTCYLIITILTQINILTWVPLELIIWLKTTAHIQNGKKSFQNKMNLLTFIYFIVLKWQLTFTWLSIIL